LKFAKVLGKENVRQGFYSHVINLTTYNLCRINMFLHDTNYEKFDIAHGDTLTDPNHWDDEPFDAIGSNPPYSLNWDGKNNPILINDPGFSHAGVLAPPSKADLAFTMHMLAGLSTRGTAAIDSSVELSNKRELINQFIALLDIGAVVDEAWQKFVDEKKLKNLSTLLKMKILTVTQPIPL
jgi:type I restriction system adenine methylase HsdM